MSKSLWYTGPDDAALRYGILSSQSYRDSITALILGLAANLSLREREPDMEVAKERESSSSMRELSFLTPETSQTSSSFSYSSSGEKRT